MIKLIDLITSNRFKLFEGSDGFPSVDIEQLLEIIRIPEPMRPTIISWWNKNRKNINIHIFKFNSSKPIAGVFLGENSIALNEGLQMPPHIKLFLALHESRHCDQHREGKFMEGYYETVLRGDKEGFLMAYKKLEKDANDFAINTMKQIGFEKEMNMEEQMLRRNEGAGEMVYQMMSNDIKKLKPVDFIDLLKKQIL
jgi:hypothetical protein